MRARSVPGERPGYRGEHRLRPAAPSTAAHRATPPARRGGARAVPFLLAGAAFAFFLWSLVIGFHSASGDDPAPWLPDAGEPPAAGTAPVERLDEAGSWTASRASRATPRPPADRYAPPAAAPPGVGPPAPTDAPRPTGDGSAGRVAAPTPPPPAMLPTMCPPPLPPSVKPRRPPRSKPPRAPKIMIGSVSASPSAGP